MQAIYKVPNGKLLKIFLEVEDDKISQLNISGDFFIYPEESITQIEQALLGQPLDGEFLKGKLDQLVQSQGIELFGVDTESIVKTILTAM